MPRNLHDGDHLKKIASADTAAGTWITYGGRTGYVDGLRTILAGEKMSIRIKGLIESAAPSSLVLADGDPVEVNVGTNAVVASGGVVVGVCVGGKVDGALKLNILLGEFPYVEPA